MSTKTNKTYAVAIEQRVFSTLKIKAKSQEEAEEIALTIDQVPDHKSVEIIQISHSKEIADIDTEFQSSVLNEFKKV